MRLFQKNIGTLRTFSSKLDSTNFPLTLIMITPFIFNLTSNRNVARSMPFPLVNKKSWTNFSMQTPLQAESVHPNPLRQLLSSLLLKLKKSMLQVSIQVFVRFKITVTLMHIPLKTVILFHFYPKSSKSLKLKQRNTSLSLTFAGDITIFGLKRVMSGKLHLSRIEAFSNLWPCFLVFAMLLLHFSI